MPTMKQIEKKYGTEVTERMKKSGWLDGITVTILPDGSHDIPQVDIDRALKAICGRAPVYDWD